MPKIDNITYPEGDERLLKFKPLGNMYRVFLKKRSAEENWRFLDQTARTIDPRKQYPVFFDDEGKYSINVDSKIKNQAKALAEAGDWKAGGWRKIYSDSRKAINLQMEVNFQDDFYKSPDFKAYHVQTLRKSIKIPKALKQHLAIEDESLLADTVVLFMSDRKAGAQAARSLSARKQSPCTPDEIGKAIARFFRVR